MMQDFLLDEDYDLQIENGDFVVGNSEAQNLMLLLLTHKNDWKKYPTCGVGAPRYLETNKSNELAREIDEQFTRDGMKVKAISINPPEVYVDAEYK